MTEMSVSAPPRTFCRDRNGNVSVELAIAIPILLSIILVAFDFGSAYQAKMRLEGAARAGIQYALLEGFKNQDTGEVKSKAVAAASEPGITPLANANYYCQCLNGTAVPCTNGTCLTGEVPLRYIHVDVTRTYDLMFDYPGLPASLVLQGDADMRIR